MASGTTALPLYHETTARLMAAFCLLSYILYDLTNQILGGGVGTWQSASVSFFPHPLLICLATSNSDNSFLQVEMKFCCLTVNDMIGSLVHTHTVVSAKTLYPSRLGDLFFRLHRDHRSVKSYKMHLFPASAPGSQVSQHFSDILHLFPPLRRFSVS